ncbi:LEAF RUST 10 DISEASE-RESISTANCE LOCUS RECEPTOR-LIKE PROTEIN KINASE-like 2.2 isoform X2 [Juglans regia]|uniref:LEAF RUST 10 DISEASE-RESISTANCE LOCUS RECEPTOR-LIKE PROTEIN KINASE-like 2.2 isoform X2 n=1 Tax=Juglans regia TaxID=51240 RepID=A0A6P9F3G0_JUGRE|nr:LEAF RUST 10 DISEASE-RESISTANCE LOCUS RECEPTOR-LIKE PROTEIN KINASE-like 2.2 isoform X2 [Juglans regia]
METTPSLLILALSFSDLWLSLLLGRRGMAFPVELKVLISTVLALILVPPASSHKNSHHYCPPSSCGNIPNISYPFRLKGDPPNCGDQRYELSCDDNNHTLLSLHDGSKYYVSQINYNNYTIRIVDSGIQEDNYSFIPRYFLNLDTLALPDWDSYPTYGSSSDNLTTLTLSEVVAIVNCEKPVTWASSLIHWDTTSTNCSYINKGYGSSSNSSFSQYSKRYLYLIVGYGAYVMDVEESCTIEQISLTSWPGQISADPNISCTDIRNVFSCGFELSWYQIYCGSCSIYDDCYINHEYNNQVRCYRWRNINTWAIFLLKQVKTADRLTKLQFRQDDYPGSSLAALLIGLLLEWRLPISVLGAPFVIAFLIYKWRRRHLSMYDDVEEFLQGQNNLMPIRYSFSEIKKMTKGFRERLGEGGFGTIFKGTLRSGRLAAVKMLSQSKANGQDFINEVATIGRIHHVNIVQLIGFCVQGSKRALIYEFMPNGSLNKHIFSSEANILNYEKTYDIALGVACGIEYLHQGCDMQILHFDIKPHNILLDENFKPKVSDFGLAKLYPVEDSIVHLTRARGTLGYMAPEMHYKNIGGISYKADVYSFGMLLMEMVSRRKNLNAFAEHLSQIYFPTWIYDQFHDGKNIEIQDATEDERKICKKMMIVALWCIQLKPSDRPSMNKVVKMLEGDVECLQVPLKPLQPSQREIKGDRDNSNQASSSFHE